MCEHKLSRLCIYLFGECTNLIMEKNAEVAAGFDESPYFFKYELSFFLRARSARIHRGIAAVSRQHNIFLLLLLFLLIINVV